jgi:hypothetical protein
MGGGFIEINNKVRTNDKSRILFTRYEKKEENSLSCAVG